MLLTEYYKAGGRTHYPDQCAGTNCCIHNPSDHAMVDWPMNLRETGLIERLCPHGVGHPDPDSARWMDETMKHRAGTWGTHGCDGCCHKPTTCAQCGKTEEECRGSDCDAQYCGHCFAGREHPGSECDV